MAETANPPQKAAAAKKGGETKLVVNDIRVQQVDRSAKGIKDWRNAHIAADSPYHPNRTRLYDLYEDVKLDGHLVGIKQKRVDSVLNKVVYYNDKSGKRVEAMDEFIGSTVFRGILRQIMETRFWGISGMEFIPGNEVKFKEIPRKNIKPEKRIITINQNDQDGGSYDGVSNIWVVGDENDLGLYLICAPYTIYKKGTWANWDKFITIFGVPMRIIRYDGEDDQTKIELQQILDESGSAMAIMIPNEANFEAIDGKQVNGDGQLQQRHIDSLNAVLSIAVLGNTESTAHDGHTGTGAKSQVHSDQQDEIIKSDIIDCTNYINSKHFQAILKSYGLPVVEGGKFGFKQEINIKYLAERIKIDLALIKAGLPIDDDYLYQTYGIPKPDNYDELKKKLEEMARAIDPEADPAEDDPEDPQPKPRKKQAKPLSHNRVSRLRNLINALKYFFG